MLQGNFIYVFLLVTGQHLASTRGQAALPEPQLTGGAICESGMSVCSTTSGMCIPNDKFCDSHVDCDDGMDEEGCWPPPLSRLSRPEASYVDSRVREDSSSAVSVPCEFGAFMCEDRTCIPLIKVCDGHRDCVRGRDEQGCNPPSPVITPRPYYATQRYEETSRASMQASTAVSQETVTEAEVKVKISIYDRVQTVNIGNDVVYRCRDESTLRVPVHWTRSGSDERLPANANDYNGRLTITKVTGENEGSYVCQAHGYPFDRQTAQLIISGGRWGSHSRSSVPNYPTEYTSTGRPRSSDAWSEAARSSNTSPSRPSTDLYSVTSPPPQSSSRLLALQRNRKMRDCDDGYISCGDGSTCIHRRQVCDHRVDCYDGSDEKGCRKNCTNHRFTCGEQCLDKSRRCDGIVDCQDGSDEFLCHNECSLSSYWCPNSQECIPQVYRCDGEFDCPDGADEKQCEKPRMLEQPSKSYTVEKGKSVTLTCRASGIPRPKIEWRFNLQRIPETSSSSMSICTTCHNCSDNEVLSSLTLTQFDERYEGRWTCEAINSVDRELAPHDTKLTLRPASPYVSGRGY